MEIIDEELIQADETEWIERRTHELILQKYRQSTQRLIKEYKNRMQQQNRKIEFLMKEVKRQKNIIDNIENGNNGFLVQNTFIGSKMEETSDLELEASSYPETETLIKTKVTNKKSQHFHHPKITYKRTINNNGHAMQSQNKKTSLLSIQIQPNIQHSTNAFNCDQCNKSMSSRRVLAV